MKYKKTKVIIDTDPGVDDTAGLVFAIYDKRLDIKLITTVVGNVKIETSTRNMLHLLDKLRVDIPVAQGAEKAMTRNSKTAEHVHKKEGMGGYVPPKTTQHKVLKEGAVEAMYKVLKEGDGDIELLVLGPHTNIGTLFTKHPDIINKIPRIVFMGGSPFGIPGFPDHISFNISSDPEAFKIVLDSKLPLVMVPSNIGRRKAHLTEEYVYFMRDQNQVGKFLYDMYSEYWERGFPDKRIATNDTCAYMYIVHPEFFKTKQADIAVDCDKEPGKTFAHFNKHGQVTVVVDAKRKKFLKTNTKMLKDLDNIRF
ncbi:MAG: nucleoside hydrolase [Clostridia bacterium]|nr:nucleoside hydrolase [Clostridia bacterium]